MRSTNSTSFVILSILMHGLVAVALVFAPSRSIAPDKTDIQVDVGTPAAEKAGGVADAPEAKEQPQAKPAVKAVAHVAKVKKATAPVAKMNPPPAEETAPAQEHENDTTVAAADETPAQEAQPQEEDKLVPVKETPPDGIEASQGDNDTEAKSEDVQKTDDPAPVGVTEEKASNAEPAKADDSDSPAKSGEADGVKGGAEKADAVTYTDLKQKPGNKPPTYPTAARLEKRQGGLELLYHVNKDGSVSDVQVSKSSGYADLDKAAVKAISQYKYMPGQEGWARHPVNFTLKGDVVTLPSQLRGKGASNED